MFVGNRDALLIKHVGSVLLDTPSSKPLLLNHVLHVPNITKNLLSISKLLADNSVTVEFLDQLCFVKAKILLEGVAKGGLYRVQSSSSESSVAFISSTTSNSNKIEYLFASCPVSLKNKSQVVNHSELHQKSVLSAVSIQYVDVNLLH